MLRRLVAPSASQQNNSRQPCFPEDATGMPTSRHARLAALLARIDQQLAPLAILRLLPLAWCPGV